MTAADLLATLRRQGATPRLDASGQRMHIAWPADNPAVRDELEPRVRDQAGPLKEALRIEARRADPAVQAVIAEGEALADRIVGWLDDGTLAALPEVRLGQVVLPGGTVNPRVMTSAPVFYGEMRVRAWRSVLVTCWPSRLEEEIRELGELVAYVRDAAGVVT